MKPISLTLKGFRGLRAGIGVDEITIDFTKLPEGLVAIVGPNGSGKTTIMDNMHPYRIMPYKLRKSKDWSPGAFSYYDQTYGEAMKEFVFNMGATSYRSLILIDSDRRKQEAYFYRADGAGGWIPLNDGKVKTYDDAVETVCGSPTLFFTSVFRAQGAKNLSDYTRGDIMAVISELLNIDHIKEQGEKARIVVTALQGMVSTDRAGIVALAAEIAQMTEVSERVAYLEDRLRDKTPALDLFRLDLQNLQTRISETQKQIASQESEKARLEQLKTLLADARTRHDNAVNEVNRDISGCQTQMENVTTAFNQSKRDAEEKANQAEKNRLEQLRLQLVDEDTRYLKTMGDIDTERAACDRRQTEITDRLAQFRKEVAEKITRAEKIVSGADNIRAKVIEEIEKQERLETAKEDVQDQEKALYELEAEDRILGEVNKQIINIDLAISKASSARNVEVQRIQSQLDQAVKDAAKLDGIKCGGDFSLCPFSEDAIAGKNSIERLEIELSSAKTASDEEQRLASERVELASQADSMADIPQQVLDHRVKDNESRTVLQGLEAELADMAKWTKLVPELNQAEENLAMWRNDLAERENESAGWLEENEQARNLLLNKLADLKTENDQRKAQLQLQAENQAAEAKVAVQQDMATREREHTERIEEISKRQGVLEQKLIDLRTELTATEADLQKQIAAFPVFDDLAGTLTALNLEEDNLKSSITETEKAIREIELEIAGLNAKLEGLDAKRAEISNTETRIEALNREIATFSMLTKACSNDGIIALELDDAAPSIATIVNDLLRACYGTRFSVRMDTQAAKINGDVKETFDIVIYDADTDEEKSITECSGGQLNWLEDAITRGICLFNIHRSDREFDALYSDEKDGMLDAEKKAEFFSVKREALKLGTHTWEFFITQTPELVDMADGRIVLTPGGVSVS